MPQSTWDMTGSTCPDGALSAVRRTTVLQPRRGDDVLAMAAAPVDLVGAVHARDHVRRGGADVILDRRAQLHVMVKVRVKVRVQSWLQ